MKVLHSCPFYSEKLGVQLRLLILTLLALPLSCGDIITGYKEPAIATGQLSAVEVADSTVGTAVLVRSGESHHCAVFSTGNVRCWGKNDFGQLGYGNTNTIGDDESPLSAGDVNVGCTVSDMALGANHTCALCNSGRVRCWGKGTSGQLGYGATANIGDNELPYLSGEVRNEAVATQVVAGADHTCVLTDEQEVRCWGKGADGRLGYASTNNIGDNEAPSTAGTVSLDDPIAMIAAGAAHTCALTTTGDVYCWGSGASGVLGYGNTNSIGDNESPSSVGKVPLGGTATKISSADKHTCVLTSTGKIRCWGDNSSQGVGFVGTEPIGDNETPGQKGDARVLGYFTDVAVGYSETCGKSLDGSGSWLCWGGTPDIPYGIAFSSVSGGGDSWCAVNSDSNIRCAGSGTNGQLGYGNTETKSEWPTASISIETPGYTQDDPLYADQWHIKNTGQHGGTPGEDANVEPVWLNDGNYGEGILISVVDDGMEIGHPDLFANILGGGSYNYLTGSSNPTGEEDDSSFSSHGTCVAGIIGARHLNGFGLRGIAPLSKLVGYNMLKNSTAANIANAMTRNSANVYVSNNSWGPSDRLGRFSASDLTWQTAIDSAITTGRGGRGTSFFWAAGNGRVSKSATLTDQSNYDGYANYYGVTAVCASGNDGNIASYSEPGANVWVCGPSLGDTGAGIYTTDRVGDVGYNPTDGTVPADQAYTSIFSGTSAAAPMVSGVAALMYKANPNLSWRDVRIILAETARKVDPGDLNWATNDAVKVSAAVPYNIHYDYGFGMVDAQAAVNLAKTWVNVGPLKTVYAPTAGAQTAGAGSIDPVDTALTSTITVAGSGISRIEYVEVTVNLTHADWGELEIQLERSGVADTVSRLTVKHDCYKADINGADTEPCTVSANTFRFGTARHLGEPADGDWTLAIFDRKAGIVGTFQSWRLRFFGE